MDTTRSIDYRCYTLVRERYPHVRRLDYMYKESMIQCHALPTNYRLLPNLNLRSSSLSSLLSLSATSSSFGATLVLFAGGGLLAAAGSVATLFP